MTKRILKRTTANALFAMIAALYAGAAAAQPPAPSILPDDSIFDEEHPLAGTGSCLRVEQNAGAIVALEVAPFAELRIEFPFPIRAAKLGGGTLWDSTFAPGTPHLWIRSSSLVAEGITTSLTVLDERMEAIDVVLTRAYSPGYTCAIINAAAETEAGFLGQLYNYQAPEDPRISILEQALADAESLREQQALILKQHAESVIASNNAAVYAAYSWAPASRDAEPLYGSVRSVHDDGIQTYISFHPDPLVGAIVSIMAEYDGREQVVQTNFNDVLSLYTVTGVYDKLVLTDDQQRQVEISRARPSR